MSTTKKTDFTINQKGYAAFDATSLKQMFIDRLNTNSQFTDQNFEGSNISSILDIVAVGYHTLLFYLNQTATESMFSESQLYENMNRIVKSLDYKPVGYQTCNLAFECTATSNLTKDTYTIPRYAFINVGGIFYSFVKDSTFSKTETGSELLDAFNQSNLLYQGTFQEYPLYTAIGEDYEFLTLLPGDDILIDHFNIDVYVKDINTGTWEQWKRTDSLFLESPTSKRYEVRLNENKRYEIKFGNDITGKKLNTDDVVAVYYLQSDGESGQVGINAINGGQMTFRNTIQFVSIFNDVKDENIRYLLDSETGYLTFANQFPSTEFYMGETVEDIRARAPKMFASQYKLISKSDYETYINQNLSNIIRSVKVVNNWDYLDGHMKYLFNDLGLKNPNSSANILYNQVFFADSCDLNNIYIYAVPRMERNTSYTIRNNYLNVAQKNQIIEILNPYKVITCEPVIMDPVYVAVDLGVKLTTESLTESVKDNTKLIVTREKNSQRSLETIKNLVVSTIQGHLSGAQLGNTINVTTMVNDILNIEGIKNIKTQRTDDSSVFIEGLSFLVWNPIYPTKDIQITSSNMTLPYYKSAYLFDYTNFADKVEVVSEAFNTAYIEY